MYLGKRRAELDHKKNLENQRQRIINFKKFFGTEEGKEVMCDLINRFHVLKAFPKTTKETRVEAIDLARFEGNREVVLYLLSRANVEVAELDKILKGEFI